MRYHEFSSSALAEIDRRGFLRGLGAAAAGALTPGPAQARRQDQTPAQQAELDRLIQRSITPTARSQAIQKVPSSSRPTAPIRLPPAEDTSPEAARARERFLIDFARRNGLSDTELQQFMAQTSHESDGFTRMVERGSRDYFFRRYDPKNSDLADNKAKKLGNTEEGDGVRFRGRGFIQLTGRDNYTRIGRALGLDLVNRPELASTPEAAARVALYFWKRRVRPGVQDFTDTPAATRPINPGLHGLERRQQRFDQYAAQKLRQ